MNRGLIAAAGFGTRLLFDCTPFVYITTCNLCFSIDHRHVQIDFS